MDRIEPFGGQVDDVRVRLSTNAIVNSLLGVAAGFGGRAPKAFDMRLPWDAPVEPVMDHLDPHSPNFDPEARAAADEAVFAKLGGCTQ